MKPTRARRQLLLQHAQIRDQLDDATHAAIEGSPDRVGAALRRLAATVVEHERADEEVHAILAVATSRCPIAALESLVARLIDHMSLEEERAYPHRGRAAHC